MQTQWDYQLFLDILAVEYLRYFVCYCLENNKQNTKRTKQIPETTSSLSSNEAFKIGDKLDPWLFHGK